MKDRLQQFRQWLIKNKQYDKDGMVEYAISEFIYQESKSTPPVEMTDEMIERFAVKHNINGYRHWVHGAKAMRDGVISNWIREQLTRKEQP